MTTLYQNEQEHKHITPDVGSLENGSVGEHNIISQEFKIWRRYLQEITVQMRQAPDIDTLLKITTREVKEQMACDRVFIYRFSSPDFGTVTAEAKTTGWTPTLDERLPLAIFGINTHQNILEAVTIDDIYQTDLTPYQKQTWDKFQIKASLSLPIVLGNEQWGLLTVNHCSSARQWQEMEIALLSQIAAELSHRIQLFEFQKQQQQQVQAEKSIVRIINKILRVSNIDQIFQAATQEVRQMLRCDRVAVYRFYPNWGGEFVAESVGSNWVKLVGPDIKTVWEDTHLQETKGGRYAKGESFTVDDIQNAGLSPCHVDILEQFEIKAYIIVPIFSGTKLWGLLAAYQNSDVRTWRAWEVNFLAQVGMQCGFAISQAEYLEQLQIKSERLSQVAEQEKTITKLVNRIRQFSNIDIIFKTTTQEVRQMLQCDRVAVYRFYPNWGGEFVAESVSSGWVRLVGSDIKTVWEDTYLQETQGGRYVRGENFLVDDIHKANLSPCHVDILQQFEAKAYMVVPVFCGAKLWGLLAAYHNAETHHWQESEANMLARIGDQLGLALQQTEQLQQLQAQSAKLAESAEREKIAKESLEKGAISLLTAVRPALNGDLTVRAPITEDTLGTIADAYNNTLQALRQIVTQLQTTAQQVAQTSGSSNLAVSGLTTLAQQQSEEISAALGELQQMLNFTQTVATSAELVQAAVQRANQTVESGNQAMNLTVEAIQAIRETVAQTGKKIKRLSESSQKISKVVNLISNFATQTNVLALNAAIEATRAGEYGKGFAVVADEVRSLSRQSAAATVEIEKLVQEIQAETDDVSVAMETGVHQVIEGTNLVSQTRQTLNEIVAATAEISQLLKEITTATQTQISQSETVATSMRDVAEIANKTFSESKEIAGVFHQLTDTAQELLVTASRFKVH